MLVALAVVAAVALFAITIYNKLVSLKNLAEEGWSGIDVQLKRRTDLIPNLLETVKGYASHEKEVFEEVTKRRSESMKPHSIDEQGRTEAALSQSLMKLMAVAENYPELKADANFRQLQNELSAIEDEIQKSRRYYNGTVRELNTKVESFPSNLVANAFSFNKFPFFELDNPADRNVPQVKF
ncbi:LemA family protein [Pararhodonellum marinum]|uniref:LemA family protein n=1 Tax=Pararhodonellum marinum TaxID=2755358 RepID=UPI00188E9998|nr:LemA family protein [Pararhodonellum marinum]